MVETAEHGGYPLFDHLRADPRRPDRVVAGVVGGVVLSLRGGDFLFESGQDLVVGYDRHDAERRARSTSSSRSRSGSPRRKPPSRSLRRGAQTRVA